MVESNAMVRTRIAPSPTGEFHIGGMRTLLYNWALARKNRGKFVLRIEDTDRKRLVRGAQKRTLDVIADYGLDWDEGPDIGGPYGPYIQSRRLAIYKKWVEKLLDSGDAYHCFCSGNRLMALRQSQRKAGKQPRYDGACRKIDPIMARRLAKTRKSVIRLKVPENEVIKFKDELRGEIAINSNEIDDQILLKSDGFPTYHLAVVVDDIEMKISHVLRAEEWLPSTPKQVLLYKAFGYPPPYFVHLTVLLDPDRKGKLSKRYGSVSARRFLEQGFLPEAVLNYLMLLGWAPKNNQEIFSLSEFVTKFSLDGLQVSSPVFDIEKLTWLNGVYLRKLEIGQLAKRFAFFSTDWQKVDQKKLESILALVQKRAKTLSEMEELIKFFIIPPKKDQKLFGKKSQERLRVAVVALEQIKDWHFTAVNGSLLDSCDSHNFLRGAFFMDLRIAITGKRITPPINESIFILGKDESLRRLKVYL